MNDYKRICANCKWWELGKGRQGWCHRFPPVAKTDTESMFPWSFADDSCGEFALAKWTDRELVKEDVKPSAFASKEKS